MEKPALIEINWSSYKKYWNCENIFQGVKNVSFSGKYAYVPIGWPLIHS